MKPSTSSLLEKIYCGEFLPYEQVMPNDPDYRPTCRKVDQGIQFFSRMLNGEDKKSFDQLIRGMRDMSSMDAYANFTFDLRSGIMLMQELSAHDEK